MEGVTDTERSTQGRELGGSSIFNKNSTLKDHSCWSITIEVTRASGWIGSVLAALFLMGTVALYRVCSTSLRYRVAKTHRMP